jgi:hypothetical protein
MYNEPIYDDDALEHMRNDSRKDLVSRLWRYALSLENYVVQLRTRINGYDECRLPYPDPASDFILRVQDHPSYAEFSDILGDECRFDPVRE